MQSHRCVVRGAVTGIVRTEGGVRVEWYDSDWAVSIVSFSTRVLFPLAGKSLRVYYLKYDLTTRSFQYTWILDDKWLNKKITTWLSSDVLKPRIRWMFSCNVHIQRVFLLRKYEMCVIKKPKNVVWCQYFVITTHIAKIEKVLVLYYMIYSKLLHVAISKYNTMESI